MKLNINLPALQATVQRFPVPVFCTLFLYLLSFSKPEIVGASMLTFSIGLYLCLAISLYAESRKWMTALTFAASMGTIAALHILLPWLMKDPAATLLLGTVAFLLMFIAPFLSRYKSDSAFWLFNYSVWIRIAQTFIISIVLFLGLSAILASLKYLFGIPIPSSSYFRIWIFIALLFGPLFAMAGIPKNFSEDEVKISALLKAQCVAQAYVVIPLLLVYSVILYAYAAFIALNGELPKGGVANLVMAFAGIGTLTYFTVYEIRASYPALSLYVRHFSKILIVPLGLMAVAIYTRIEEYGVTEQRYMVAAALVFFAAFICIDNFVKKFPLRLIYAVLIALLLLSAVGPLNVTSVSMNSQQQRLKNLLTENNLIEGRKLVKADGDVSFEDRKQISSILDYMLQKNRRNQLTKWMDIKEGDYSARVMEEMGLEYASRYTKKDDNKKNLRYNRDRPEESEITKVSGYDYLSPFYAYIENGKSRRTDQKLLNRQPLRVKYISSLKQIQVFKKDINILVFDLSNLSKFPANSEDFYFEAHNENLSGKIIVKNISAERNGGKIDIKNLSGTLLLKGKL